MNTEFNPKDIPRTTISWEMTKKARRKKFLIIGLFIGVIAAYYLTMEFISQQEADELVPVVISTVAIEPGATLSSANLQNIEIPKQYLPVNAIKSISEIENAVAVLPLSENQMLTIDHIRSNVDPNSLANMIAGGKELFIIPEHWLESPIPDLGKGDRINVLTVDPKDIKPQTRVIASDLSVIKMITKNSERMLAVELDESQAKNLLLARAFRFPMMLIIHSR